MPNQLTKTDEVWFDDILTDKSSTESNPQLETANLVGFDYDKAQRNSNYNTLSAPAQLINHNAGLGVPEAQKDGKIKTKVYWIAVLPHA
jgi:hypothetical protein